MSLPGYDPVPLGPDSTAQPGLLQSGPTFEQGGPQHQEAFAQIGADLMSFDEFLRTYPPDTRLLVYDSIMAALTISPTTVPDWVVEILGEGFYKDQAAATYGDKPGITWERIGQPAEQKIGLVGDPAGINQYWMPHQNGSPNPELLEVLPSVLGRQASASVTRPVGDATQPFRTLADRYVAPGATWDDFVNGIAEGNPEAGIPGDPTLKQFTSGGSLLKYPVGYVDRKAFASMFSFATQVLPVGRATSALSAAQAGGRAAVKAGVSALGAGRLTGMSRPAVMLRTAAGIAGKGIVSFAAKAGAALRNPWIRKPFIGLASTATGFGFLKLIDDVANPKVAQEIQTAAVGDFQDALADGRVSEAEAILEGARSQGFSTNAFTIDPVAGTRRRLPDGTLLPSSAADAVREGYQRLLEGEAARIGPGGHVTRIPYETPEGDPLFEERELLGVFEGYVANKWITMDHAIALGHRTDPLWEDRDLKTRQDRASFGERWSQEARKPIFRTNDDLTYLSRLTPGMLVAHQAMLKDAGYMEGTTIEGVLFQPGVIDAHTTRAMNMLMEDMNRGGEHDVLTFLRQRATVGAGRGKPSGGGYMRAPFARRAYLAPDYDTLAQFVKQAARSQLGRELNNSELSLLADQIGKDHRAAFDMEEKARLAEYQAAGRGGDPGVVGEQVDPEASFREFFETRYAKELDRRERTTFVEESSRNLFGSLQRAADLATGGR